VKDLIEKRQIAVNAEGRKNQGKLANELTQAGELAEMTKEIGKELATKSAERDFAVGKEEEAHAKEGRCRLQPVFASTE